MFIDEGRQLLIDGSSPDVTLFGIGHGPSIGLTLAEVARR